MYNSRKEARQLRTWKMTKTQTQAYQSIKHHKCGLLREENSGKSHNRFRELLRTFLKEAV